MSEAVESAVVKKPPVKVSLSASWPTLRNSLTTLPDPSVLGSGLSSVSRRTSLPLNDADDQVGSALATSKSNSKPVVAVVVMLVAVRIPGLRSPAGATVPVPLTAPTVPEPSSPPWSSTTSTPE